LIVCARFFQAGLAEAMEVPTTTMVADVVESGVSQLKAAATDAVHGVADATAKVVNDVGTHLPEAIVAKEQTVHGSEDKASRPPLSTEERVARGIAPVKAEFLWSPEEREQWKKERAGSAEGGPSGEGPDDGKVSGSKKSKRAQKKARAEAKKVHAALQDLLLHFSCALD
jgi:hypothetical protein